MFLFILLAFAIVLFIYRHFHIFISSDIRFTANTNNVPQPYNQFGWFTPTFGRGQGVHQLTRADLGDYWSHLYGQRHLCRGKLHPDNPDDPVQPHDFWLDMWVTQTKRRTHEQGG
jgi:hypothetical protein